MLSNDGSQLLKNVQKLFLILTAVRLTLKFRMDVDEPSLRRPEDEKIRKHRLPDRNRLTQGLRQR